MQIYGLFTNAGAMRPTAPGTSTASETVNSENKTPASAALRLVSGNESNADRAAAAKKKLDEIKEQLRMLRFWASDPETLARLAKQLAQQLGTAAQQLGGAGATGGTSDATSASGAAAAAAAALAEAANAQAGDTEIAEQAVTTPDQSTFVARAYREFDGDDDQSDLTVRVAAELKSVAEQLKQILRKAEQDLRAKGSGRGADAARTASHALSAAVGQLGGTDATAAAALTIPTSVSI
ncbi:MULTISPECIES: hypothetical protein [unclassified Ensifer]|uniref:hypothetical protein n=1 Tax=unclassified Ensifer TaxID=2633371 RepID=UPI0008132C9F|nr:MULTISPECIES: hypothetical protein [unclassified Ensifer]OCP00848.1 hypothetical protein BC374_28635 [Ensifer sp. LC13]OCP01663.1 hypothetical protein BBX50_28630 [Ensifer sp. LC11]OCP07298.1 hypothetical protein BC362_11205 [Ensifer sp. LC14]OCP29718.1 hypothetical protein BC364_28650 [Ensifer sp. LC499]